MPVLARPLKVLGEFKPFGLIAEALDGKPDENSNESYSYFLFDPQITRQRDDFSVCDSSEPGSCDRGDHELFIRGSRMIWSTGSRVHRRYTSHAPITMACWCRMDSISEPVLCVLQANTLTIYNVCGAVTRVPLAHTVISIWPLPFGLLLQRAADGTRPPQLHFSSPNQLLNMRDLPRPIREFGSSPHLNFNTLHAAGHNLSSDQYMVPSHLILKHPLEEPQAIFLDEKGKFSIMKDFDEKTIWTSDSIPLVASYHKGKMQHSAWLVEIVDEKASTSIPVNQFSFRRIWQGKCSQSAASKVFLATDDDGVPIICFLLQEQRGLLSVRLQTDEHNNEILYDVKSHMSWSIPAVAAASVIVTRPRIKLGLLPFTDIVVLDPENSLLLYTGKKCLCKYQLPSYLGKGLAPKEMEQTDLATSSHGLKLLDVADAVDGRINVMISNGQIFRCALRQSPSSSLANDCITTMAEGMHPSFYNHFVTLLWADHDLAYLSSADSCINLEWCSFSRVVMELCQSSGCISQKNSKLTPQTSWEFLVNSKFHLNYCKQTPLADQLFNMSPVQSGSDVFDRFQLGEQHQEKSFCAQLLSEMLDSLHALYESLKLDILRKRDVSILVILLCDVAASLGEASYVDHYLRDFPYLSQKLFGTIASSLRTRNPPSVMRWLENSLLRGPCSATSADLPPLICKDGSSVVSWARKIVSFYSFLLGSERIGRKLSTGVYFSLAVGSASSTSELMVLAMVAEKFGLQQLDLLPPGVSLPLRHALDKCRESPPTDWPAAAYVLVGREDLALRCLENVSKSWENGLLSTENLIRNSSPYMLHMHPVTIPPSLSEVTGFESVKMEESDSLIGSMVDGMEHMFNSSTQLRYGRDLRLNEVRRLLSSARLVPIQTSVNPSASDQELQQAQLWQLAQRTTALPFGRGAFTLASICTLLTEALDVPKLVLAGRLPAQQNATVNLDPNMRNIMELRSWPEFHNGVAAGLKLAPFQVKMSRTWITYNKPEHLNVSHAGLLFALGLHGHLRVLTIADVYQYLSPEHDSTIVGMLLGMAASYRGTMQPAVSKMLYLHLPSRHPSSFPELELPTLLQSAALMAIGLLYEGSAHPLSMKTLLSEIGRRSCGDNVLEREGYAVAAGSALGLVTLGQGKDAFGFRDAVVERLFQYIGGKEFLNDRSFLRAPAMEDQSCSVGQMMDGTMVNVDVTAPGATIALALMFLKTESEEVASRLSIPQTHFSLQYVRPDFIMLRVLARNMIMWSRVFPSRGWIESQIPEIVKMGVERIRDETSDGDEMDFEAVCQAYVNIVAGSCISLGLRYAGTRNMDAQELLYSYAVYLLNEIKPISAVSGKTFPKGLSQYVDRPTLETCLHLIVLSLSVVMAGSGHLQTLRLLRYLRRRNSADGHASFGIQMAVSLAIGFLFLGGGMRSFSTGNSAVAMLLITLYPRLPTGPNDNRCHLQAFRHLYVLATEPRVVQTVDVDTGLPVYAPLEVTIKETENHSETSFCEVTPCILPERSIIKTVRVCGPRYWPQVIEIEPQDKPWWRPGDKNDPFNGGLIYVKRKVGACSYVDDPIGRQSLLSRAMHKVSDTTSHANLVASNISKSLPGSVKVDQLISTFSSDPSLIAFAQLCCDSSWNNRSDDDFKEFCFQVLFDCVSKDRPALLEIYLSFYTSVGSMAEQMTGGTVCGDTLFLSSLKIAIAYNEALVGGKLSNLREGIMQSMFIGALKERIETILKCSLEGNDSIRNYLKEGKWPQGELNGDKRGAVLLSWFVQWFGIPSPNVLRLTVEKVRGKVLMGSSSLPLLRLLLPTTHVGALGLISESHFSSRVSG
ncbi:anaphase-promoting complex subunit 1 isoform X2 [Aristolochia californica]|uniref:anaphase-promoting complex subunit 1 isoform X2 n=1 Tax=Aristolochia californica TaxID=171875 RepID=UPI0035DF5B1F